MNLTLPLNFGERQCDRLLLASLHAEFTGGRIKSVMLWMAFLIWKDFGIARDDRRIVPLDPSARATCPAVAIIEQFAGWEGAPGALVEACISSGFFLLAPADDSQAELILVDFFPANHSAARDISNAKLGGIGKGMNIARKAAAAAADEQLNFFKQSNHSLLDAHGKEDLLEALLFIHQTCKVLRRQPPVAEEWKQALTVKALDVRSKHSPEEIEATFKWFIANRDSQQVAMRIDFILDRFSEFVDLAKKDFL